jgi:hypothetical protein
MTQARIPSDARRAVRHEVCYRCEMSGIDFPAASGLIVNLSAQGCMIRCSQDAPCGTALRFALPILGQWQGTVVWAIGGRIGVEFDQHIPLQSYLPVLDQMMRPNDEMGVY